MSSSFVAQQATNALLSSTSKSALDSIFFLIKTAAESFYDIITDYIDYYEGINKDLDISNPNFNHIANSRAVDLYSLQDEIKNIIDFCDRYS